MNLLWILRPLIKAVRDHNLVIALVVATALVGWSLHGVVRELLGELGIPILFAWIVALVLVGLAARYDKYLPISDRHRRLAAKTLLLTSLAFFTLMFVYQRYILPPPPENESADRVVERGPRGK